MTTITRLSGTTSKTNYARSLILNGERKFTSLGDTPLRTLAEGFTLVRTSQMSAEQKEALFSDPKLNNELAINALNDLLHGKPFYRIIRDLYATASGRHLENVGWRTHAPQILKYLGQKAGQYLIFDPYLDRLRQQDPAKAERLKTQLTKLGLITACGGGGIPVPA